MDYFNYISEKKSAEISDGIERVSVCLSDRLLQVGNKSVFLSAATASLLAHCIELPGEVHHTDELLERGILKEENDAEQAVNETTLYGVFTLSNAPLRVLEIVNDRNDEFERSGIVFKGLKKKQTEVDSTMIEPATLPPSSRKEQTLEKKIEQKNSKPVKRKVSSENKSIDEAFVKDNPVVAYLVGRPGGATYAELLQQVYNKHPDKNLTQLKLLLSRYIEHARFSSNYQDRKIVYHKIPSINNGKEEIRAYLIKKIRPYYD